MVICPWGETWIPIPYNKSTASVQLTFNPGHRSFNGSFIESVRTYQSGAVSFPKMDTYKCNQMKVNQSKR